MSSWQSGNLIRYSQRMFSKQSNMLSTSFQVAGTCCPPPLNPNPFSIHLVQDCLTTFSVQLQGTLPSPCCQLFPQLTHFPLLPLYNTLHLCNAFLSKLSKFFQIYYFISLLDNPIMNTGISNPKFVNSLDSQKPFGCWLLGTQRQNIECGCQGSLNMPTCICTWIIVLYECHYMDHHIWCACRIINQKYKCRFWENIFLCWLPGNRIWAFLIQYCTVLIFKPHNGGTLKKG